MGGEEKQIHIYISKTMRIVELRLFANDLRRRQMMDICLISEDHVLVAIPKGIIEARAIGTDDRPIRKFFEEIEQPTSFITEVIAT